VGYKRTKEPHSCGVGKHKWKLRSVESENFMILRLWQALVEAMQRRQGRRLPSDDAVVARLLVDVSQVRLCNERSDTGGELEWGSE
jgi:hypothetical protein